MCPDGIHETLTTITQFQQLLPLIASAITGGLIAIFAGPISHTLFRPKLQLSFEGTGPNGEIDENSGYIALTDMYNDNREFVGQAYYIRIKVENTKRWIHHIFGFHRVIRSCRAYLVNVEQQSENGEFEPTIYVDSLLLNWSCKGKNEITTITDIPYGVTQFFDVIQCEQLGAPDGPHIFLMQFDTHIARYGRLFGNLPKTLRLTIQVSGDGVTPETIQLIFKWNGLWNNFELS